MKQLYLGITWLIMALPAFAQEPIHWPQFRGPDGCAQAKDAKALPVHFDPEKNVVWKTALPAGVSSPCIWSDRIFLTGHDAKQKLLETICLDRSNGKILWRRTAPADKIESVYKVNSPAAATPASDGKRVYVSFGSYGLLGYDFDGKEKMAKAIAKTARRLRHRHLAHRGWESRAS